MPASKRIFVGLAFGVVVSSVIGGFLLLGSPVQERVRRLDNRRVDDLGKIRRATDLYWTRHGRLPSSLQELSQEPGVVVNSRDPGATQRYEYRVLSISTYELCASFERNSGEERYGIDKDFWSHGAGRQCFQLEARDIRR